MVKLPPIKKPASADDTPEPKPKLKAPLPPRGDRQPFSLAGGIQQPSSFPLTKEQIDRQQAIQGARADVKAAEQKAKAKNTLFEARQKLQLQQAKNPVIRTETTTQDAAKPEIPREGKKLK